MKKKFWKNFGLVVLGVSLGVGAVYGIQNREKIGSWCKEQWNNRRRNNETVEVDETEEPKDEAEPQNTAERPNRPWRHRRYGRPQNQAA